MHAENIDLNLLYALQALLAERHVTRAATRMGLTQPAMSHALSRLRAQLSDPILVRARGGLQLTPRAAGLVEPLARMLSEVGTLLEPPGEFNPATSRRLFRIAASDYIEIVLWPRLLERISREAPSVDIALIRHDGHGVGAVEDGKADFLLVPPSELERGGTAILSQRVLSEKFVCVVRKDHPSIGKRMTLEKYLALPHVLVSPRGGRAGNVDDALTKIGRTRRVAVTVPHFLVAPFLIERSDFVLTLPSRILAAMLPVVKVRALAPPPELPLPGFDIRLVWHERDQLDPAHAWLRSLIAAVAKDVS